jgi:hypothetical protein
MKVGRHSLTLHAMKESEKDKDVKVKGELIAEFIFYAVDPPNRGSLRVLAHLPPSHILLAGSTIKPPLMAMGKSMACSGKKGADDPVLVIGKDPPLASTPLLCSKSAHCLRLHVRQARVGAVAGAAVGQEGRI